MTTVTFDIRDWSDDGDVPSSGYLLCRYTSPLHPDHYLVTMKPFRVSLTDGIGTADVAPTPDGVALKVVPRLAGLPTRWVLIPDSGTHNFCDLTEVDPDSLDPVAPDPAWVSALADETAEREAADEALQSAIDAVEAGDVDSVAGLSGTVTAGDLKTALNLPADTATTTAGLQTQIDNLDGTYATDAVLAAEATTRGNADTALSDRITTIENELDTWVPGTELGYAERATSATTTATSSGASTAISSLSVTVTGKGRPVDIEFYSAGVWHSVANTFILVALDANGSIIQTGTAASTATNNGRSHIVRTRLVLTDGVSYTFTVKPFTSGVAGTSTIYAAASQKMTLSVTSR